MSTFGDSLDRLITRLTRLEDRFRTLKQDVQAYQRNLIAKSRHEGSETINRLAEEISVLLDEADIAGVAIKDPSKLTQIPSKLVELEIEIHKEDR